MQYVDTERTDEIDAYGYSPNSIHTFTGHLVPKEEEKTSIARAFLVGNHTLINIKERINSSPD